MVMSTLWTPISLAAKPSVEPWDICPAAPHKWALMADAAIVEGHIRRAEELITLAYACYDAAYASDGSGDGEPTSVD